MDTLCEHLEDHLLAFSSVNRTRCFSNILNLVAKSLLKLFDVKKKKRHDEVDDDIDRDLQVSDEERELLDLADGVDDEELTMAQENDIDDGDEVEEDDEDEDGWVNELEVLTEEERENLKEILRPISKMLIKVSSRDFTLTVAEDTVM
jgi:hypothetical protein